MFLFIFPLLVTMAVASVPANNTNETTAKPLANLTSLILEICKNQNPTCSCPAKKCEEKKEEIFEYIPNVGIYKFHSEKRTFNEARKVCMEEGGHLAIINSAAEQQVLFNIWSKFKDSLTKEDNPWAGIWLGIHCLYSKNDWVTVLGDSLNNTGGFNQWAKNEPNNNYSAEKCGTLLRTGYLNDLPCDYKIPYICEIEIK